MGFPSRKKIASDVLYLLEKMDKSQWNHITILPTGDIINRTDLQEMQMIHTTYQSKTSGSTGVPVTVEKSYDDFIWYIASGIRDYRWSNWDISKNVAIISHTSDIVDINNWNIPVEIEPIQGKMYCNNTKSIIDLQKWLDIKNPHYILCPPSVFKLLDLTKVTNYIDHKGTGEVSGSIYSSEECGIIALTCPDNKSVYHVMENQVIETDIDGSLIITTLTNLYIKRYLHGDYIELGECTCGRKLQTISKINGRKRNMLVLPNDDKMWPTIGSKDYYKLFGIKQFKMIQKEINKLEISIVSKPLDVNKLTDFIKNSLGIEIDIDVIYVEEFSNYKYEEFISLI